MSRSLTIENPAYFDRLAEIESAHWWSLGVWRLASHWLEKVLKGRRNLRAVDVGCGTGMTVLRLLENPAIGSVVGLDPSPDALELARSRHNAPLCLGSALQLPFRNACSRLLHVLISFSICRRKLTALRSPRSFACWFRVVLC